MLTGAPPPSYLALQGAMKVFERSKSAQHMVDRPNLIFHLHLVDLNDDKKDSEKTAFLTRKNCLQNLSPKHCIGLIWTVFIICEKGTPFLLTVCTLPFLAPTIDDVATTATRCPPIW